jgi:hypothetical protein
MQRIKEIISWFFEKINKIDKSLANLTNMSKKRTQIIKIRNKKEELQQTPKKSW